MVQITASMVKDLRVRSGAGMMDCKRALVETDGDFDRAVDFLREKGIAKAAGKVGRETTEGRVTTLISSDSRTGAVIEVGCETDFVARTDDFITFCEAIAEQVATEKAPESLGEFLARPFKSKPDVSVEFALKELFAKLGENMLVRRVEKFEAPDSGALSAYVHPGDKLGVVIEFSHVSSSDSEVFKTLSRDIAMHVAATGPKAVSRDELDQALIEKEREIYRQQALNEGKPEKIVDKIVNGKIDKYYSEVSLLEQSFVKDPDVTVSELLKSKSAEVGEGITVSRFARFVLGEVS
jgi:elongation factor Ts